MNNAASYTIKLIAHLLQLFLEDVHLSIPYKTFTYISELRRQQPEIPILK